MQSHATIATAFVGRARELDILRTRLYAACAGSGSVVLLAGEPGIGKTRLLEELARHARECGATVLWGRCWEGEGAPAFWPWLQVLRAHVRDHDPATLAEQMGPGAADIAQVVPEVRAALPNLPLPPDLPPEQARFRFFDSLTAFLQRAATVQPLVLLLDDLHWADAPSLLLLEFVAQDISASRLLVVGTYRDVEVAGAHPLGATLAALRRSAAHERIMLAGLSEEETAQLTLAAGPAIAGEDRAFVRALHERTEGNPFFVQELLRHLAETGGPVLGGRRAVGALEKSGGVPTGVREVVSRRLVRLSEGCQRLLTVASVIGREFDAAALAHAAGDGDGATGAEAQAVLDLLAEAETARLIAAVEAAPGRYRFGHALVRETIYEGSTTAQRVRLHRRVGEALETVYHANPEPHLAELAHHFHEAVPGGDAMRAIEYATRAGERASAVFAWEEAVRYYELALDPLDRLAPPDDARRLALLLALGEAQMRSGDVAAQESFRRAAALARALDRPEDLARAALSFGWIFRDMTRPDADVIELLDAAREALGDQETALAAEVLARLGAGLFWSGESERGYHLGVRAVALARKVGNLQSLGRVLRWSFGVYPRGEERRRVLEEMGRIAETSKDLLATVAYCECRSFEAFHEGNIEDARSAVLESKAAVEMLARSGPSMVVYGLPQSVLAHIAGRFAEAERLIEQTLVASRQYRYAMIALQAGTARFFIHREIGRLAEREVGLARSFERDPIPLTLAMLAFLYSELGRLDEARAAFDKAAVGRFATTDAHSFRLAALALLAEVCTALGDEEQADVLYRLLLPEEGYLAAVLDLISLGPVSRYLGMLAATMRRWDDADRHFCDALASCEQMPSPPWAAWTRHGHACMLLARNQPGDCDRAIQMLDRAEATAADLGMVRLQQAIAQVRPNLRTATVAARPSVASRLPDRLTPREVEIAGLIAEGHSNSQMAEQLVVSVRTVERHVENIYIKLGVHGPTARAAVASYATRHGLVLDG